MKRLFVVLFLVIVGGIISFFYLKSQGQTASPKPIIKTQPPDITTDDGNTKTTPTSSHERKGTQISWEIVRDIRKLSLHSNLDSKLSADEAKKEFGCNLLVSGGFYDTNDTHLGLFIENGNTLSEDRKSNLSNGYIYINEGKAQISVNAPDKAQYALQNGPLLMLDEKPISVSTTNNDSARRIVAAIDRNGNVIFMVFYKLDSVYSGPTLDELPQLVKNISNEQNLRLTDAINLDGGSASTFISDNLVLKELTKIGSFFCVSSELQIY
jgi:uncharacterized protein YigE (DUF2233 family)